MKKVSTVAAKQSRNFSQPKLTIRLLLNLKTDYGLDLVRSDPRFAELLRRVGLPQ